MNESVASSAGVRLLGPADVRELAARYEIRPTKQRGQNFVTEPNTVRRIVKLAALDVDDTVMEVGPGLGSLTLALIDQVARVIAVEIDPALAEALPTTVADRAPEYADRLTVVQADALRMPRLEPPAPTALVANLPYNVAVPVLLTLLETFASIRRVLVMVQLEVANRLAAQPGSKLYGVPSVKAAWYCDVRRVGLVGRRVFWPVPNVDSGLVAMRRHPPQATASREAVFAVVDAAFGQRRKMLRTALAGVAGSATAAEAAIRAAGLDPTVRGERLLVGEFARVAAQLEPAP